MPRPLRALGAVLLLVLASLVLGACGGGGDSAASLLKQTFGPNKPVRSGNLDLSLAFDAKGLKTLTAPVALKLKGPFQSLGKGKLPRFDFALSVNAGTSFSAGAISTGDKGYLKFAGQSYAVSDPLFNQFKTGYEQASKSSTSKSSGPSFSSLGIDPQHWLTDPKKAGTESVGGTETYHLTAGIDVGRFLTDVDKLLSKAGSLGQGKVPTSLSPQQRRDIQSSVTSAKLDVWTGKDDKTLRRLKVNIAFDVPSDVRSRAGGLQSGKLDFDVLIGALNQPQSITAPANARPLSDLTGALGGAAGTASGGSGSAPTTPAPTAPAPTAPAPTTAPSGSKKYLDCLQKAGSDIAAVQKCATLVGQ